MNYAFQVLAQHLYGFQIWTYLLGRSDVDWARIKLVKALSTKFGDFI